MREKVINKYIESKNYVVLKIINTKGVVANCLIDKMDYPNVKKYKWSLSIHGDDIRIIGNDRKIGRIYLHQFLIGPIEKTLIIDHIDRNPLNNQRNNLRITSRSINSTNARARSESKTGIRGVYKREARPKIASESWVCEWSIEGKRYSKSFSIKKYGEEEAFRRAYSLRKEKLEEMKI